MDKRLEEVASIADYQPKTTIIDDDLETLLSQVRKDTNYQYQAKSSTLPQTRRATVIEEGFQLVYAGLKEDKGQIIDADNAEASAARIMGGIKSVTDKVDAYERYQASHPVIKVITQFLGKVPEYNLEEMTSIMQESIEDVADVFESLARKHANDYLRMRSHRENLAHEIVGSCELLERLEHKIDQNNGSIKKIDKALERFKDRQVDYRNPKEVQTYMELSQTRSHYASENSAMLNKYLSTTDNLYRKWDNDKELNSLMLVNDRVMFNIHDIVTSSKNLLEDSKREQEIYGSIAQSSSIVERMYASLTNARQLHHAGFKTDMKAVEDMNSAYDLDITKRKRQYTERAKKISALVEQAKQPYTGLPEPRTFG